MRLPSMVLPSGMLWEAFEPLERVLLTTPVTKAITMTAMMINMVVRFGTGPPRSLQAWSYRL